MKSWGFSQVLLSPSERTFFNEASSGFWDDEVPSDASAKSGP